MVKAAREAALFIPRGTNPPGSRSKRRFSVAARPIFVAPWTATTGAAVKHEGVIMKIGG
jgi:hypothetical protein